MSSPDSRGGLRVSIAVSQRIGDRPHQQDTISRTREFKVPDAGGPVAVGVFAVADGMGGFGTGGGEASRVAARGVTRLHPANVEQLELAVQRADDRLVQHNVEVYLDHPPATTDPNGYPLQGTTLVAGVLTARGEDDDLRVDLVHVGDTAAFIRRRGQGVQLVNPLENALDSQGQRTNALTNFLGDVFRGRNGQPLLDPWVNRTLLRLQPGDQLLVCTDGVYGSLSQSLVEGILDHPDTTYGKARRLVTAAVSQGRPYADNASALLIERR